MTGCDLLWAMYGVDPWATDPTWSGEPPLPEPTILATYTEGSATIEITRAGDAVETVTLGRVGSGSELNDWVGATVSWRGDDGWGLTVTAYDKYSGDVALHRINDSEVWRADAYTYTGGNRCVVEIEESSAELVSGTAKCYDMRWVDGLTTAYDFEPAYIEGAEPFDAEITFEARP